MSVASSTQRREYLFKIIVVGDISTGKTSLIQRYVRNMVNPLYKPTIGVDFATKLVKYEDTLVRLQFWDTAGHDRFANMMRIYYRDSHGAVVLCDCTKKDTITGAFRWKKDIDYKLALDNGEPIPAILLANKCDLKNGFSTAELHEMAIQAGFRAAFKISAKNNTNVEESMDFLIRQILNAEKEGLYVTPVHNRDHNVRKIDMSDEELNRKRGLKSTLKNVCC